MKIHENTDGNEMRRTLSRKKSCINQAHMPQGNIENADAQRTYINKTQQQTQKSANKQASKTDRNAKQKKNQPCNVIRETKANEDQLIRLRKTTNKKHKLQKTANKQHIFIN